MESINFAEEVKKTVVDENLKIYKDLFSNTDITKVKDQYWKNALSFFNNLDDECKNVFFSILKQVEVDTTSNILGILDGVSRLDGQKTNFVLTLENNNNIINGELQDCFLELMENE